MAGMIAYGEYDVVIASHISGKGPLSGRHALIQIHLKPLFDAGPRMLIAYKLSEYHTGFRGFRRNVLETLPLETNSDDFVFDNEMLAQANKLSDLGWARSPAPPDILPRRRRSISRDRYAMVFGVLATSVKVSASIE